MGRPHSPIVQSTDGVGVNLLVICGRARIIRFQCDGDANTGARLIIRQGNWPLSGGAEVHLHCRNEQS